MSEKVSLRPRLDLVLAKKIYEESITEEVSGPVDNPIIKPVGSLVEIPRYMEIVSENPTITDLKEGDIFLYTGQPEEVWYGGEIFYLIRNANILAVDEE